MAYGRGRASVAFRVDLPDGRAIVIQTSLRTFNAAHTAIVAKYGEPFMQHPLQDREHKLALAVQDLTRQLADAKQRLGEPVAVNFETGDATWDREQQLREALSLARSYLLASDAPLSDDLSDRIDAALSGRKPK